MEVVTYRPLVGHTLPPGLNRVNFSICDRMLRFTCGLRNN
jgi:hypothetical protein